MAEGSLRAAPKSLFRNTYRSTALNHTTSLWVWDFPQANPGDKTQTRHTAGPMEKKPQRERIAFRRPGSQLARLTRRTPRQPPAAVEARFARTRNTPFAIRLRSARTRAPLSTLARPSRSACRLAPSLPQALPLRRASTLRPRTPATPVFFAFQNPYCFTTVEC